MNTVVVAYMLMFSRYNVYDVHHLFEFVSMPTFANRHQI